MKAKTITAKRLNELIKEIPDNWNDFIVTAGSLTPPATATIKDADGNEQAIVTIDKSPGEAGEFIVTCECKEDDCFHSQVLWKLLIETHRKREEEAEPVPAKKEKTPEEVDFERGSGEPVATLSEADKDNPNLSVWKELTRPPARALKQIRGGRLSGMSDINPQWRLKMMTQQFGPIGIGWYYEMLERWTEKGSPLPAVKPLELGEFMCFVSINLYVKVDGEWSKPIFGLGGSKLFEKEKDHFYNNDEGYKMALTDALSVAMKELGMAADIYMGLWDGSKYTIDY